MKLPELLKQAILDEDWKKVCVVYTTITGEAIEPPKPKIEVNLWDMDIPDDVLDQLVKIENDEEQGVFPLNISSEEPEPLASKKKEVERDNDVPSKHENNENFISRIYRGDKPDFSKKKEDGKVEARKESIAIPKNRTNRFQDDQTVAAKDLKDNNEQLKKLYSTSSGRAPRLIIEGEESSASNVNVVCCLCDEADSVAKALAVGYDDDPDNNSYHCNSCSTPSGRAKALRKKKESTLTPSRKK